VAGPLSASKPAGKPRSTWEFSRSIFPSTSAIPGEAEEVMNREAINRRRVCFFIGAAILVLNMIFDNRNIYIKMIQSCSVFWRYQVIMNYHDKCHEIAG
jgi:hypothetical protein